MLEWIVLGLIQGVTEWLPVSSEGMVVLAQTWLWPGRSLTEGIEVSLWLHMGTWLAAVVYFWSEIKRLSFSLFSLPKASEVDKKVIMFLFISTLISGGLGFGLLELLGAYEDKALASGRMVMGLVGGLLLITGWLQLRVKEFNTRSESSLNFSDSLILGIAQGLAALPGFSRSGLTVASLLLRKFDKERALKLSFLMSIPIVLAGNILLNADELVGFKEINPYLGILAAFVTGWLTIEWLMKVATRVNFGWFVVGMGVLSLVAAVV